jgi:hypothetical protein
MNDRLDKVKDLISDIYISESLFFYDKNEKHIKSVGKKLSALDYAIKNLEEVAKKQYK